MKKKIKYASASLIFLTLVLSFIFFSSIPKTILAGYGTGNITVITNLTVGNVYPEVLNVSIEDGSASFTLIPNSTRTLRCVAIIRDFNGEQDINATGKVNSTFFDNITSTYEGTNDNNTNYTNSSCFLDLSFDPYNGYTDDAYTLLANCTFQVQYYANASDWNCTVRVNDSYGWEARGNDLITISPLLALGLPDFIDYGTVNATYVSGENITNVTNYGNVPLNLSLNGYGFYPGDGNAMNCTLGSNKNITIENHKYNLTLAHTGDYTLSSFIVNYTNLTTDPVVKEFDLDFRHNENINEAWNHTYWRIYVPTGVAGTCSGNVIFAATQANGN